MQTKCKDTSLHLINISWQDQYLKRSKQRYLKIRRPLAKGGARLEASLAGASDPSFFAWLNPAAVLRTKG